MPTEPRFLIIDLHQKIAVPATTGEMQALVWREELKPPADAAYIEKNTPQRRTESIPSVTK